MNRALVVCHGYLGDHLFASSIAKKLMDEDQFNVVDYIIGFPQVIPLFKCNPYINEVLFEGNVTPSPRVYFIATGVDEYDKIIQLGPLSFVESPCIEFQKIAGVRNPSPEFHVYTDLTLDSVVKLQIEQLRNSAPNKPVVAVMNNWEPKAFLFTEEEYRIGNNIPYKGYGGKLRNIQYIIDSLQHHVSLIGVGAGPGISQFNTAYDIPGVTSFVEEASILKYCDYFVGPEGGLANLAAGVGTKTIIGSEFVAQLYGPNGCIRKIDVPMLGPHQFFKDVKHSFLNPYLTDQQFIDTVLSVIQNDLHIIYDWTTNSGGTIQ